MSIDVKLYEDENIEIAYTKGGWGARFWIKEKHFIKKGETKPYPGDYSNRLITIEDINDIRDKLLELSNCLRNINEEID